MNEIKKEEATEFNIKREHDYLVKTITEVKQEPENVETLGIETKIPSFVNEHPFINLEEHSVGEKGMIIQFENGTNQTNAVTTRYPIPILPKPQLPQEGIINNVNISSIKLKLPLRTDLGNIKTDATASEKGTLEFKEEIENAETSSKDTVVPSIVQPEYKHTSEDDGSKVDEPTYSNILVYDPLAGNSYVLQNLILNSVDTCEQNVLVYKPQEEMPSEISGKKSSVKNAEKDPLDTSTVNQVLCKVCQAECPGQVFYGGICCYSCRIFFRRAAVTGAVFHCCVGDGGCVVSRDTRIKCKHCRYMR